jgi:hypothetical protein
LIHLNNINFKNKVMKKLITSLLFVLITQHMWADKITTSTLNHYGKITAITPFTITLSEGCQGTASTFPWDSRTSIAFNDLCVPPPGDLSASPHIIQPKCSRQTSVFEFRLKNVQSTFYCSSVSFDGNNFKFVLKDGREFIIQDFSHNKSVDYLWYSTECTDSIKAPEQIPDFVVAISAVATQSQLNQNTCTVKLSTPLNNDSLKQFAMAGGRVRTAWRFSWLPCPGATKYQLFVIHPSALNPLINKDAITTTNYSYNGTGYGPMTSLNGWTWKVRAYVGEQWQEWSETRTFDIIPLPCSISGIVRGNLTYESYSDVGGEHHPITLKTVFLMTTDRVVVQRATLRNRQYIFEKVPSNKTYRIYVEPAFISDPEYIEITNTTPRASYINRNFKIRGIKGEG